MKYIKSFFDSLFNSGVIQSFRMAMKSILSNKMRSLLTMLGIIIGVISLVVLVSIVSGGTDTITKSINKLGVRGVNVNIYEYDNINQRITYDELLKLADDTPELGIVSPQLKGSGSGQFNGKTVDRINVIAADLGTFKAANSSMLLGREFKQIDLDNRSNVCIVARSSAEKTIGYVECIGEEVTFNGVKYKIIGVANGSTGGIVDALMGMGSFQMYIPYTTATKNVFSANPTIENFSAMPADGYTVADARYAVEQYIESKELDKDNYWIEDQSEFEQELGTITTVLSVVLGSIAGISLFVGGIGIMNIMLVTVTERTKEIGIRKAIGASRGVILRQFLFEAVVICLLGCGIGIFLSWFILRVGSVITGSLGVEFVMNPTIVIVAVVFCFFIGLIFGLYPANKAAKMKPIDALHYGG